MGRIQGTWGVFRPLQSFNLFGVPDCRSARLQRLEVEGARGNLKLTNESSMRGLGPRRRNLFRGCRAARRSSRCVVALGFRIGPPLRAQRPAPEHWSTLKPILGCVQLELHGGGSSSILSFTWMGCFVPQLSKAGEYVQDLLVSSSVLRSFLVLRLLWHQVHDSFRRVSVSDQLLARAYLQAFLGYKSDPNPGC